MPLSKFKVIYSRLGIKTGITDEKLIFQFFSSKRDPSLIDFRKITGLVLVLAKKHLKELEQKGKKVFQQDYGSFVQNNSYKA